MKVTNPILALVKKIKPTLEETTEIFHHKIMVIGKSVVDIAYKEGTESVHEIEITINDKRDISAFMDTIEYYTGELILGTMEDLLIGKVKLPGYSVTYTKDSLKLTAVA